MLAYLLETLPYGDREIVADDWPMPEFAGATILATLELTASYDHWLRTADETAFIVGCEAAASVMAPILCAVWGRPLESWRHDVDYVAAIHAVGIPYDGEGWAHDTSERREYAAGLSDDIGPDDIGPALYEWCDEIVAAAQDVGWIIETSSDCGMTWFYRPMV